MKKFVLLFCIFMLPLTLASDTQHRFKVYVEVGGDDEGAVRTIESHLKREFRLLGDVDIVGENDDWEFTVETFFISNKYKDGRKTGTYAVATYNAIRVPEWHFTNPETYKDRQPTAFGKLSAGYMHQDMLPRYCVEYVGSFEKDTLEVYREGLRR